LCLPQSGGDQRANVHAGGVCECNDNHFTGKLFEGEGRAVLIDQRKIFNRSARDAPVGASRLNFSGNAAARETCKNSRN
jgi:hypothetical protein